MTHRTPLPAMSTAGGCVPFAALQSTLASGGAETASGANTPTVPTAFAVRSPSTSTASRTYFLPGSTVIANHRASGYAENACRNDVPSGTSRRPLGDATPKRTTNPSPAPGAEV
jgi:hypothetical protein